MALAEGAGFVHSVPGPQHPAPLLPLTPSRSASDLWALCLVPPLQPAAPPAPLPSSSSGGGGSRASRSAAAALLSAAASPPPPPITFPAAAAARAAADATPHALVITSPCASVYAALDPHTLRPLGPIALNPFLTVHSVGSIFFDTEGYELPFPLGFRSSFLHLCFAAGSAAPAPAPAPSPLRSASAPPPGPVRPLVLAEYTVDTRLRTMAPSAPEYERTARQKVEAENLAAARRGAAEEGQRKAGLVPSAWPPPAPQRVPGYPFRTCPPIHSRFVMGQPLFSRAFFLGMSPLGGGGGGAASSTQALGFEGYHIGQVWLSAEAAISAAIRRTLGGGQ